MYLRASEDTAVANPADTLRMAIPRSGLRLFLLLLASVLVVGAVLPIPSVHAQSAEEKPTLLGFVTDHRSELGGFIAEAGKPPALYQLYWALEKDWAGGEQFWVPGMLDDLDAFGTTPYVEITTLNLDALNNGSQDNQLQAMAQMVETWVNDGGNRHVLIAPLPEMNLNHAWGGDPAGFKAGYEKIRNAFINVGLGSDQVRFVFAPNGTSDVGEHEDYYPGDPVVDVIGFARINRGAPWLDYNSVFQTHIDELQGRVSLSKPILITQTGSVTPSDDRDIWLEEMFANLKANDQVIGAVYFSLNRDHDYRVLVNGTMDRALRNGYVSWSPPDEVDWIFDGRMDAWVQERKAAYASGFVDIQGHTFQTAITWLAGEGITQGCNPPFNTRYCPQDAVSRGQMAVFIARAMSLPAASGDYFSDDTGEFYEGAANRLFEASITVGCAPNRYCGGQSIPREQMAAFLARILGLASTTTDHFVDDDGTFERAINKLAEAGITSGCNPPANDRYCPSDLVTRGQMAAFIRRALP